MNLEQIKTDIENEITERAPASEPERQYFFMGCAKRLVEALSQAKGEPLTSHVQTFGCQVNTEREIKKSPKTRAFCFNCKNGAEKLRQFRGNFKALTSGFHS